MVPQLKDDGQTITLDLHGARVTEAERLAEAVVIEAARHGRATVRLIHGVSTSEWGDGRRTIKSAIHEMLDDGEFQRHVASVVRGDGHVLLGIAPAPRPIPGRVRLQDLTS